MKGSTEPRLWTPPLRELTERTSLGFAAIQYAKTVLGKTLYPVAGVGADPRAGDRRRPQGEWQFPVQDDRLNGSRQNGKTVLSEVIASFFLNVLCVDSIFGTSLSLDKAEEVWEAVVQDQEAIPAASRGSRARSRTNGNKKLDSDRQPAV